MSYKFTGIDGGLTAAANPALTLTAFQAPVAITNATAGDITLGCTYAAGALVSGSVFPSRGLMLNLGNDVQYTPLLGSESVNITNREISGSFELELTAAEQVTAMTAINANTLTGVGFSYGTTSGNKILVHMPAVQRINPKNTDINGIRLIGMDIRATPSSGNDELRVVVY